MHDSLNKKLNKNPSRLKYIVFYLKKYLNTFLYLNVVKSRICPLKSYARPMNFELLNLMYYKNMLNDSSFIQFYLFLCTFIQLNIAIKYC